MNSIKNNMKLMNSSKNKLNTEILLIYNSLLSVHLPTDVCAFCISFGWSHGTVHGPANFSKTQQ